MLILEITLILRRCNVFLCNVSDLPSTLASRLIYFWFLQAKVAKKHNIDLTFFHGKGGTVGRGGNPATFKAILSHAPDTINGKFRVTEQVS